MGELAIETVQAPPAPAPMGEVASIIQAIERAALDPRVDIDKMERLIQMQERILATRSRAAFMEAFARMQQDLPTIKERGGIKDRAGNVQSRYALWEDINEAIKPVLAKHGFSLSFRTEQREGRIVVTGILGHQEGHREETTMELPHDSTGSKNAVQAIGSSTSYGKRYTAAALLNLTSRDGGEKDDDGRAAGGAETISDEQADELIDLIEAVCANRQKFLAYLGVESLNQILAKDFKRAVDALKAKGAK
jgi:hypothetical protein